ncbi:MAG TPA: hypothetical protein IAB35_01055 [Candidatus Faecimonas gallistercoris]|nr:hypothetical protein [Candidatus Faecimonas gallistercoris]
MYPNPYLMNLTPKASLLTRGLQAIKTVKWSSLLEGTQKTLGVINQAIPIVYQIKPIMNNAKTIFKIADSIRDTKTPQEKAPQQQTTATTTSNITTPSNSPIFYI